MNGAPTTAAGASAVRALLLTDVVDSTKLSERIGDAAMARVWAAHDRVARDLLPPWRGREIDKTDGMLLLFDDAADAVQYAQAYHAGLASIAVSLPFDLPWALRARAGLHVGPVILRENAPDDVLRGAKPLEVDGMAKPTAARVMSVARGGQTLLTPEARAALGTALDDLGLPLQSHGFWVLKGVAEPVELCEVGPDAAAFAPPPDGDKAYRVLQVAGRWLPVRQMPNNLPEPPNAFIGRERELADLRQLLGQSRLLTLLGMGGLGKTRLSLQVAAEQMAEFANGVWFLDLAPLRDGSLVLAEAAQVLGVREEPGRPLLQTLCAQLKSQRTLIILDNCEHLLKPAAQLAQAVLKAAPGVRFIASSREPLRISGERSYTIQPLPVPRAGDGVAALARSPAVQLFVERAQEHRPDFSLTEAEAPAVAELVARLEGIPLALELAAARLRSMTVADINRRLKSRYKLLTGGSVDRDERQQTLRALVDWSYDLLQPTEQAALQRLAVFAGGLDLAAAEAVCADEQVELDDVMDLLRSLVEKSLVVPEQREGAGRYRLLETIREYAAEKLAGSGEGRATAARHCEHFFALCKQGRDGMQGPQQRQWLDRLDLEQDNLRAAIALAQTEDSPVSPLIALKMAVALQNFWVMRGGAREGRAVVQAMLAHAAVQALPMAQAHALYLGAALAWTQGDLDEALRMLQNCLVLRRALGVPSEVGATLSTLAVTLLDNGDAVAARDAAAEAVELLRQSGHRVGEAIARVQLAQVAAALSDAPTARAHLEAAMALARHIRHPETEGEAELRLGELETEAGDESAARTALLRSLKVCSGAGDLRGEAHAQRALGRLELRAGRRAAALPLLQQSLAAFERFEMRGPWLACVEDHAVLALAAGLPEAACNLAAAAQGLRDSARLRRLPPSQVRWQAFIDALRAGLPVAGFDASWQAAQNWDAAELARSVTTLGAELSERLSGTQGVVVP